MVPGFGRFRRRAPRQSVLLVSGFGEDTGGGLFSIRGSDLEQIDSVSSTGLAVSGDRLARLLRSPGEAGSIGELLVYDPHGVRRYHRLDEVRDPHGVAWDGDLLVVASTSTNSVLWIAPSGEVVRRFEPAGSGDAWHLNSLFAGSGDVFAAAFGVFSRHREWKEAIGEPTGIVVELGSGKVVLSGLDCPHDPRLRNGNWIVCASARSELRELERSTGTTIRSASLRGWTRGLAHSGDLVFVGESAPRPISKERSHASVAVLSADSWELLDRLDLPCQEIYDIVVASPELLDGVRTGFDVNSTRTGERNQLGLFEDVGVEPVRLWALGDPLPPDACRIGMQAELPDRLETDTFVELRCKVENRGTAILVSAPPNPVNVAYRWFRRDGDESSEFIEGLRTPLPKALPPGGGCECAIGVQTPSEAGSFELRLTLVQEQIAWFDDIDPGNAVTSMVEIGMRT